MTRLIRISYEVITPESADIGEIDDSGWIDEDGVVIDPEVDPRIEDASYKEWAVLNAAVGVIGCHRQASCYPFVPGFTWYTETAGDEDYATGAVTYKSWHLSGFTPEEEQAIYNEVTK
jgi:hypothetical protein